MPSFRPDRLSEEILKDPFRSAERYFYDSCKSLPSSWYVLYGVPWISRERTGGRNEGEADFVVIGPSIGVVVVEIKGGRISHDSTGWYSVDRHGVEHPIKNPFEQAQRSKYELLRFLKEPRLLGNRRFPISHCVCFPSVRRSDVPLLPEAPTALSITAESQPKLEVAIQQVATFSGMGAGDVLDAEICRQIAEALKPTFAMPGRWGIVCMQQSAVFDQLTSEQASIVRAMEPNRYIGLTGPAGSGKTLIALQWIEKQSRAGYRPLVLTTGGATAPLLPSHASDRST